MIANKIDEELKSRNALNPFIHHFYSLHTRDIVRSAQFYSIVDAGTSKIGAVSKSQSVHGGTVNVLETSSWRISVSLKKFTFSFRKCSVSQCRKIYIGILQMCHRAQNLQDSLVPRKHLYTKRWAFLFAERMLISSNQKSLWCSYTGVKHWELIQSVCLHGLKKTKVTAIVWLVSRANKQSSSPSE